MDAYSSLCEQDAHWEWLLQIDGGQEDLPAMPDDERVHVEANGVQVGEATTRNRALGRAKGELVFGLDADDVLLPGALTALSEALLSDDRLALAFGGVHHLDEHGRRVPGEKPPFAPGVVKPGTAERLWHENSVPPIFGPSVLWRRSVLAAYGGWAALTGSADTSVIMAASLEHPTICVEREVVLYRHHPGQMTRSAAYHQNRQRNWDLIHLRLQGMRLTTGKPLPEAVAEVAPRAPDPPSQPVDAASPTAARRFLGAVRRRRRAT